MQPVTAALLMICLLSMLQQLIAYSFESVQHDVQLHF